MTALRITRIRIVTTIIMIIYLYTSKRELSTNLWNQNKNKTTTFGNRV